MQNSKKKLPAGFRQFADDLFAEVWPVEGYLTPVEVRFLTLLAACPTADGEILEIGSFKGKSTILLAKSAMLSDRAVVNAVDPMTVPCETDPDLNGDESSLKDFTRNIEQHGVSECVVLHQMLSSQLAETWDKPLRLLWIDGDHTYKGTKMDFVGFESHLADNGIVAFHDVLRVFEGGARVFAEDVLLSPNFGACGFCGSIAWAQFHKDPKKTENHRNHKLRLYKKLSRIIPYIVLGRELKGWDKKKYKIFRSRVPRSAVDPQRWLDSIN